MIYNAAKVRRLSTIFQVYTCKTKKERIAHVQLSPAMIYNAQGSDSKTTKLSRYIAKVEIQGFIICKGQEVVSTIYNWQGSEDYLQNTCKTKKDRSAHAQLRTL